MDEYYPNQNQNPYIFCHITACDVNFGWVTLAKSQIINTFWHASLQNFNVQRCTVFFTIGSYGAWSSRLIFPQIKRVTLIRQIMYLEWPEEVGGIFEVLSNSKDFMD